VTLDKVRVTVVENREPQDLMRAEQRRQALAEVEQVRLASAPTALWEILVPTEKRVKSVRLNGETDSEYGRRNAYTTRYHRVWDQKVREISGGLTILTPAKGQWVAPSGELHSERMIPVRIVASREQIEKIIDFTIEYYDQLAVLCYKLSDEVILRHVCDKGCRYAREVGMTEHRCAKGCMMTMESTNGNA